MHHPYQNDIPYHQSTNEMHLTGSQVSNPYMSENVQTQKQYSVQPQPQQQPLHHGYQMSPTTYQQNMQHPMPQQHTASNVQPMHPSNNYPQYYPYHQQNSNIPHPNMSGQMTSPQTQILPPPPQPSQQQQQQLESNVNIQDRDTNPWYNHIQKEGPYIPEPMTHTSNMSSLNPNKNPINMNTSNQNISPYEQNQYETTSIQNSNTNSDCYSGNQQQMQPRYMSQNINSNDNHMSPNTMMPSNMNNQMQQHPPLQQSQPLPQQQTQNMPNNYYQSDFNPNEVPPQNMQYSMLSPPTYQPQQQHEYQVNNVPSLPHSMANSPMNAPISQNPILQNQQKPNEYNLKFENTNRSQMHHTKEVI